MKVTANKAELPTITSSKLVNPLPDSDLLHKPFCSRKPPRRKTKNSGTGVRLKRDIAGGKKSRPETPLLRWKYNEDVNDNAACTWDADKSTVELGRKSGRKVKTLVSARKLAAGLWRLQLPEVPNIPPQNLAFQAGHVDVPFYGHHHHSEENDSHINDTVQSPRSVSGPRNGLFHKLEPSFQYSNSAMEGATKWDPVGWQIAEEIKEIYGHHKVPDKQSKNAAMISKLEGELEQARSRIYQLEMERRSSKKKLEQFLRKLSEEKTAWRSREHEKIRAIIDDMKADLSRERKNRQRLEIVNSKLVNEVADAKLSAKRYFQDYEKERKGRELIEEVCEELAKEIGEDKAEVEALKRESQTLREEVDEERKMLQMAEVWREERVQMKLVDAKVTLEEKYSQMNRLIAELESFLSSIGMNHGEEVIKRAEQLQQTAASVDIRDITEFTYEPPHPDDIFSVFEDVNFIENNDREIEPSPAYSPDGGVYNKDNFHRHSHADVNQSDDLEEEGSEWETVSHLDEQGSSYSPEGSISSTNRKYSNVSRGDGTPITEISEVCLGPGRQLKKVSSISRLWKSNGDNYKKISVEGMNGRLSNCAVLSPDHGSSKSGFSASDLAGQWSSPDSTNPQITRGMKGCIEWPRNSHKHSLKSKLLEARMESQKVQLRHVLKQKI
ncbi:uncharacterized protein LOC107767834 [Nicotiana tabacum]|uniref:Uncharacterized protein LOC107767834 n=1 Tax=Nicotiana tabacum TaxID=4097 RepID=A0A1S3XRV7_TOBAC|nr:uncharacterized protein LOC104118088 [Nicotiana tomentosiformis]XP_016442417.1 PREDICTED: uncharacterized protein LOC107767834 [Nicotiana tabacum]